MAPPAPSEASFDPGSFRDPASRVLVAGGEVRRVLSPEGARDHRAVAGTRFFREWMEEGRIVRTWVEDEDPLVLGHERVPFWSYPYEWSFEMLRSAALLHLDLLDAALAEGMTLKDATPYNIQFLGPRPVFVDVGSFRPLEPGEPWLGYGQFCRLFLYPLLVQAHAGLPFRPLLRGSLDGITPAQARAVLRGRRTLRPGVLADVVLHARAERSAAAKDRDLRRDLGQAGFKPEMIRANLRRLRKVVSRTTWSPSSSTWSGYASMGHVTSQRAAKERFVSEVCHQRRRRSVWDLGANDGYFSRVGAPQADLVVAVDGDEPVMDRLYRSLAADGPGNVLPLVVDLADPSPGLGWRGRERLPLEARGRPDLALALALVHHLVISANLPLAEVVDWLASLGGEVVFEWVPRHDPMARRLLVNKRVGEVHVDYTEEALRSLLRERFAVLREEQVEERTLFHLAPPG